MAVSSAAGLPVSSKVRSAPSPPRAARASPAEATTCAPSRRASAARAGDRLDRRPAPAAGTGPAAPVVHRPTTPCPSTATRSPSRGRPSSTRLMAVSCDGSSTAFSAGIPSGTGNASSTAVTKWLAWGWNENTRRPSQARVHPLAHRHHRRRRRSSHSGRDSGTTPPCSAGRVSSRGRSAGQLPAIGQQLGPGADRRERRPHQQLPGPGGAAQLSSTTSTWPGPVKTRARGSRLAPAERARQDPVVGQTVQRPSRPAGAASSRSSEPSADMPAQQARAPPSPPRSRPASAQEAGEHLAAALDHHAADARLARAPSAGGRDRPSRWPRRAGAAPRPPSPPAGPRSSSRAFSVQAMRTGRPPPAASTLAQTGRAQAAVQHHRAGAGPLPQPHRQRRVVRQQRADADDDHVVGGPQGVGERERLVAAQPVWLALVERDAAIQALRPGQRDEWPPVPSVGALGFTKIIEHAPDHVCGGVRLGQASSLPVSDDPFAPKVCSLGEACAAFNIDAYPRTALAVRVRR